MIGSPAEPQRHANSFLYQNGGPCEKFESEGKGVLRSPYSLNSLVLGQSMKEIMQLLSYVEDIIQSNVIGPPDQPYKFGV